jgi:uncharacterized protein with HEPN domain
VIDKGKRRVVDRIEDICNAIANARNDLGALTKEQFLADGKTQRAVIESLIVIGEAANHILNAFPELKAENSEVHDQFRDAYDMRIVLTHEYFRVDAFIVWDTIKNDLPKLENTILEFVPSDILDKRVLQDELKKIK